ncbi:FAD-dependent oxidoreductase [Pedobacter cryoconitis]|uniref:Flavin-dependent monooxygenase n=1 Tax=Pedobacter cryoconitis TaxID=188932 RepID=A0A327S790_9SPHI|nr:NAD(P)/FAD-dependent oxidoreductase [Pedobacter cryoconitis]RAJ24899.1 2-polyprenyl-6-methoxyphenol hydroxylase-like FAD-dependent oxidoreductase [Pedobacter cryoconitis]
MNTIENKQIAIVGGGPGGLTLARILQNRGAAVKVYERDADKDARAKGATLDLHYESGLKAINEAGLMEEFKANYRPGADKLRVTDQHANIIFDDQGNREATGAPETFRPEIDRGPLQQILLDSLAPETVVWGNHFISLSPKGEGWNLEFQNGNSVYADLVIAADGANSKIRPYMTPVKAVYSGVTVVEGAVYNSELACPEIHRLLNGGKIFAMGNEKSLIVSSKGDGSLVFYTGCNIQEQWSRESGVDYSDKYQVIDWFKKEYEGWDKVWLELFENASSGFIPRPQYYMPLDQNWEALPNLTMLGDAAHLMPPYAGEGVNMAMLDALELSNCLTNSDFSDLKSAIAAYEENMRLRAVEVTEATLESTAALHSPDAISYLINIIS